jgi:hypothetical protein
MLTFALRHAGRDTFTVGNNVTTDFSLFIHQGINEEEEKKKNMIG